MTKRLDAQLRKTARRSRAKRALRWSIAITVLLYIIPLGGFVAYPLMLFSTLVHELGHGLTALAVGGSFERMVIFSDGSGVATHGGLGDGAAVARALVSAGGLLGPAIVAGVGFALARTARGSRIALGLGGLFLVAMMAIFIRNPFGLVFTGLVVGGLGWTVWRCSDEVAQIVLVFLAIQMSLSVFSRGDYLFVSEAHTGAGVMPSDTAHMAMALGGTYWLWGLVCGAFSVAVLWLGFWVFNRATAPGQ